MRLALITSGVSADDSAFWCAAWESEAERQGLRADTPYFWDAGRGWIDAQRPRPARPGPVRPTSGRQATRPPSFSVVRSSTVSPWSRTGPGARTHLVRSFALEGRAQLDHGERAKPWFGIHPSSICLQVCRGFAPCPYRHGLFDVAGGSTGAGCGMSLGERIREVGRTKCRDALTGRGLSAELVERWCDAWEREAEQRGWERTGEFWETGRLWIDAQIAVRRSPDAVLARR